MDDSLKDPPLPSFKSIEEECAYWKERYAEVKQKLVETKQEFTDFEDNSRQLEAELETCLEQREKTIQDLKHSLDQLQTDNESLRVCIQMRWEIMVYLIVCLCAFGIIIFTCVLDNRKRFPALKRIITP